MRKIIAITLLVLLASLFSFYYYNFVRGIKVSQKHQISFELLGGGNVDLRVADGFHYISEIDEQYSPAGNTLFLEVYETTVANIFLSKKSKQWHRIIHVRDNTRVISCCGNSKPLRP